MDRPRFGVSEHVFEPDPVQVDVDGHLRHTEAHERQKHRGMIGMIREHDGDAVAGGDAERGQTVRQPAHAIAELAEARDRAAEKTERLVRIVAGSSRDQLADRSMRRYGSRDAC